MRRLWRILVPVALLVLGIVLLIGCLPIPATKQLQPDNRLRPEHFVGPEPDKAVRLGSTRIEDAFIEISRRTGATASSGSWWPGADRANPTWSLLHWTVSPDRRQFIRQYQLRTVTWVVPLCFTAMQQTEDRWLVLEVDASGIVRRATTVSQPPLPPELSQMTPAEWLAVFDEPARQKLVAAGVFPSDTVLRAAEQKRQEQQQQRMQMRPPARQPLFPQPTSPAPAPTSRPVQRAPSKW